MSAPETITLYPNGVAVLVDKTWPLTFRTRTRLAMAHEPKASSSPDGFRLATCVVCERPMVAMWHLWVNFKEVRIPDLVETNMVKEIHMCHACATDIFGAPTPPAIPGEVWDGLDADR